MWNIMFVIIFSLAVNGSLENSSIGLKIAISILFLFLEIMIIKKDILQEQQQDRIKALEKRVKELVGENNE